MAAVDALRDVLAPGFAEDPGRIRAALPHVEKVFYGLPNEFVEVLEATAKTSHEPALCEFLARCLHLDGDLESAAFYCLLGRDFPEYLFLEDTLFSTEILTTIIDFYISQHGGSAMGSLASVRRALSTRQDDSYANSLAGRSSALSLGHRSSADSLNTMGQSARVQDDLQSLGDGFAPRTSSLSLTRQDQRSLGSMASVGSLEGRGGGPAREDATLLLTELAGASPLEETITPMLLGADAEVISAVVSRVLGASSQESVLSFCLQTAGRSAAGEADSDPAIFALGARSTQDSHSARTAHATQASQASQAPQAGSEPAEPAEAAEAAEVTEVTEGISSVAAPLLGITPGASTSLYALMSEKTLSKIQADAATSVDLHFRVSVLTAVGKEYLARKLWLNALLCFAKCRETDLVLDVLMAVLDTVDYSADERELNHSVSVLAQLCFTLYEILPRSAVEGISLGLQVRTRDADPFKRSLAYLIARSIFSGQVQTDFLAEYLDQAEVRRLDQVALRRILRKDLRISDKGVLLLASQTMLALMEACTGAAEFGSAIPGSKSMNALQTWDLYSFNALKGITTRSCGLGGPETVYGHQLDALQMGTPNPSAPNMDSYSLGGAVLGYAYMNAEHTDSSVRRTGDEADTFAVDIDQENLGIDADTVVTPFERLVELASARQSFDLSADGHQAEAQGIALALGLVTLGSGQDGISDLIATYLHQTSPGATLHPDGQYGAFLGLGLSNMGNLEFFDSELCKEYVIPALTSEHERCRRGAGLCLAFLCYRRADEATHLIQDLFTRAASIATGTEASGIVGSLTRSAALAMGLAYAGTRSLEVAKKLMSIATLTEEDEGCKAAIQSIALLFLHDSLPALELLRTAAQSHRSAAREGASQAIGLLMAGTWNRAALDLLRTLMSDHIEAVRAEAYIATALVLQCCPAPTLPRPVEIEQEGEDEKDAKAAGAKKSESAAGETEASGAAAVVTAAAPAAGGAAKPSKPTCPPRLPPAIAKMLSSFTSDESFEKRRSVRVSELTPSQLAAVKARNRLLTVPGRLQDRARDWKAYHDCPEADWRLSACAGPTGQTSASLRELDDVDAYFESEEALLHTYCAQFRQDLLGILTEKKLFEATDLGTRAAMLALGLVNAGGCSLSFTMETSSGLPSDISVAAAILFCEGRNWHPLAPAIVLGMHHNVITPVSVTTDLQGVTMLLQFQPVDAVLLLDSQKSYPWPNYTVESVPIPLDSYTKHARLSVDAAGKLLTQERPRDEELAACFSKVREAKRVATSHFLREANSAGLEGAGEVLAEVLHEEAKDRAKSAGSRDGAATQTAVQAAVIPEEYTVLQTPCRLLQQQVDSVYLPSSGEWKFLGRARRGMSVMEPVSPPV